MTWAISETPRQLIDKTIDHFGQLDILVNNAGTIRRAPATEYSEEDWATVIEVNLSSVFRMAQLAGRHMIERGGGKILNIASLLSFQGGITVPAYAASKGGVAQLTKALANEWAAKNINVNAIAPGYMRTDNTKRACNRTRRATGRYSNEFQPGVGASLVIWAVPPCFCVQLRATTSTVTCWWLTEAGWEGDSLRSRRQHKAWGEASGTPGGIR